MKTWIADLASPDGLMEIDVGLSLREWVARCGHVEFPYLDTEVCRQTVEKRPYLGYAVYLRSIPNLLVSRPRNLAPLSYSGGG